MISASILSIENDLEKIKEINNLDVDYIHLDVMDNIFVPNKAFSFEKIKEISKYITKPIDVHLMVKDIDLYVNNISYLHPEYITFHYEALTDLSVINKIKEICKVGISIKPSTKVEDIYNILPLVDQVLIMSVEPGFGGQEFILSSLEKISKLKEYIKNNNLNVLISVDGGINNNSSKLCIEKGADILVIGSALTNAEDKELFIKNVKYYQK